MDDSSKAAKAALWYTISNILIRGISIFTAPIFTRLLSTADYGIYNNFLSWVSIIACITGLGLTTAVLRGKVEFKDDFNRYLSSVQFLGMAWCSLFAIVMVIGRHCFAEIMELDEISILIMAAYLLFSPSLSFGQIYIRFSYKYKENVAISIICTALNVIVSIVLILYLSEAKYLGRIIGFVFPTILFGILFVIIIIIKGKCFIDFDYWKYALKLSVPMIPHGLAMIVLGMMDRIMIIKYCGESEAGIYSFGYSYAVLLSIITNAISDAVKPQMYNMLDDHHENEMASYAYRLMLLGIMLTISIIGIGPEVLRILGTKDYYEAIWVIFPVATGTMMQYIYQFFSMIELYSKKTYYMPIGSCVAAVINYFLNILFIPRYGYIAAAYTTLVAYGCLMIFHFFMARIAFKKKIFGLKKVCLLSVFMIAVGFILNSLYKTIPLRYVCYVLLFIVMFLYLKNDIKKICKTLIRKGRK